MKHVTVNLKKMVALFALSGTVGLAMTGCNTKKEIINSQDVVLESQEDMKETIMLEEIESEEGKESLESVTPKPVSFEKEVAADDSIIIIQSQWKNHVGMESPGIHIKAPNEGHILTEEEYDAINCELAKTQGITISFEKINVEQLDFSKINALQIETFRFDSCKGKVDLNALKAWKNLKVLELEKTDFEHLDSLTGLEVFILDKGDSDTFSLHHPLEQILEDLKSTSVAVLSLRNFPVSSVPLDLYQLDIAYPTTEDVPSTLTCSAKMLVLYSANDQEKASLPTITNQTSTKGLLALTNFDLASCQAFDWNQYDSIHLSSCNLHGSLEEMTKYPNVEFSSITFDKNETITYSSQKIQDEITYTKRNCNGIEESFSVAIPKEKVKTK